MLNLCSVEVKMGQSASRLKTFFFFQEAKLQESIERAEGAKMYRLYITEKHEEARRIHGYVYCLVIKRVFALFEFRNIAL